METTDNKPGKKQSIGYFLLLFFGFIAIICGLGYLVNLIL